MVELIEMQLDESLLEESALDIQGYHSQNQRASNHSFNLL